MEKTLEDEINEWLDEYGFQVPYNGTNNFYNDEKIKHARAGIDFIKPKLLSQVASLTAENEKLKSEAKFFQRDFEQIPKLQKENSRLREERKEYYELVKDLRPMIGNRDFIQKNDRFYSMQARIQSLLSKFPEVHNTTLTKEQMRQQEDLSEQREEYD